MDIYNTPLAFEVAIKACVITEVRQQVTSHQTAESRKRHFREEKRHVHVGKTRGRREKERERVLIAVCRG